VFQYQVQFALSGTAFRASDNYFDLYPGIPHRVEVKTARAIPLRQFEKQLGTMSLADSY
jgi:hypothetical protein